MYSLDKASGYLVAEGEIQQNLKDFTFAKKFIKDGTKFGYVCGEGGGFGGTVYKWTRFPELVHSWYVYIYGTEWDAIIYIPKNDIVFCGFGANAHYEQKDLKLEFKWIHNDNESDVYQWEANDADKDENK